MCTRNGSSFRNRGLLVLDVEHEAFAFICKEDGIEIYKKKEDRDGVWKIIGSLHLSLKDLINHKIDSLKPLFEFR
jgi:hypothetical protein